MPSSFTTSLRLTLPVTGENSGTWGDLVNTGVTDLVDSSVAGYAAVTMTDANYTLTTANGAADQARSMMLNMTGTLTAAREVICPTASKLYFIKNATTGGFAITLKTSGGTGISIPNGRSMVLMCDGTNVREAVDYFNSLNTSAIGATTPGTGAFTTLSASSTVSGVGFSAYLASPPAIGGTAAAAGSFTTLSASSTVSGTGFSAYLASPPAIGATAASTGAFTSLAYSTTLTGGTGVINFGSGQFYKDASGNVGINTTSPGSTLDVKGTLRLSGSTSGYVGFIPAAAAGATTYTLPSADGTSGQVLQTNGSSVLSWATPATGISNFTSNLNTTAPNATVPYVQLLATNAATNVDVAITPKGTGAFSLQVADNATAGGNKRGTNAIDLQTLRSSASQVASGDSAVAVGAYNTASGNNSFVAGNANTASGAASITMGSGNSASSTYSVAIGQSNTASGSYSFALGETNLAGTEYSVVLGGKLGSSRSLVGNKVFPAGFGLTSGARQLTFVILGLDTTDATTSYLTSIGINSINSTSGNIVLANNSAFYFKGTIVAGVTSGGNTKGWTIEGMVKRGASAATVTFVGTPTVTSSFADAGASSWTITVATNTTIGGINIVATGQASTNIRWVGNFEVVEMTY